MGEVETIAILGSGTMGIDLGVLAALHGFDVILWHRTDHKIAYARLKSRLERYVAREILTLAEVHSVKAHIRTTNLLDEISQSDLVIESIAEDPIEKSLLLKKVGQVISARCIVVTNTSSLSIETLATHSGCPDRFAGLHFFNPALKMELVEIVRCSFTSPDTIIALKQIASLLEKTTVEVNDSPGFIVNRLMSVQIREAILLVEHGVASPADVDVAVKLGLGHPIGPLALADLVGLDVMLSIFKTLHKETSSPTFEPPGYLIKKVAAGHLGRKTGQGFFDYTKQ